MSRTHALVVLLCAVPLVVARADQGSFKNSGGSGSGGGGVSISSSVTTPAGSLTLSCRGAGPATCSGGSLNYYSTDGITTITGSFTSGSYAESCSGGGKGGHVTCGFTLTGYFSGVLTVNGAAQAIVGVTYQAFNVGGAPQGTTAYNSAYTPFYYADSEQIHRSDDLNGTNQVSCCAQIGQGFYGSNGIALDSAGRIYVADAYNSRIVRIDDMNGTNWTTYGGVYGSGPGQFSNPSGIAVDSSGRIYVLDAGNGRVVRIDNMTGANWVSYGSLGTGAGQFASYLSSIALDSSGRIYVADTGNRRIVRFDDLTGANWTALTQSAPVNGVSYSFASPVAVAVDPAGRIYVGDSGTYQPSVVRVDDMTGINWTSIYLGANAGLNSIAVDAAGTVFIGGGGAKFVDNMAAVLYSNGAIGPIGPYYVFGLTPAPLPSPRPSAISFSPPALSFSENVGTSSSQSVAISNFGGSPLHTFTVSASGPFTQTNACPAQLNPGATCTVNVTFTPSAAGSVTGALNISDDSYNMGTVQTVPVSGTGTVPAATVSPASLNFSNQIVNSDCYRNRTLGARTNCAPGRA